MTPAFQKRIRDWGDYFYLPRLSKLSENGYKKQFGRLNTGIPHHLFQRNVSIALSRVQKFSDQAKQI
jgi:hypothetical protein